MPHGDAEPPMDEPSGETRPISSTTSAAEDMEPGWVRSEPLTLHTHLSQAELPPGRTPVAQPLLLVAERSARISSHGAAQTPPPPLRAVSASVSVTATPCALCQIRDNGLVEIITDLRARVAFLTSQLELAELKTSVVATPSDCAAARCGEPARAAAVALEVVPTPSLRLAALPSHAPTILLLAPSAGPRLPPAPSKALPKAPPSSPRDKRANLQSFCRRWSTGQEDMRARNTWPSGRSSQISPTSPRANQLQATLEDEANAELESLVQSKGFGTVKDLELATSVPTTPRRGTRQRRVRQELRSLVARASMRSLSPSRHNSSIAAANAAADLALEPTRIDTSRPTGAVDFADLELVRPLGSGAYGAVSLMRHAPTGVLYAVKAVSKAHITAGPSASKLVFRLRREREALYALRGHPCVIALHGTAADATHVYLITELCMGGELFGLLADGPLPEEHARFYGASVLLALEAAHTRGIVFRDLKPENVLLDSAGWVRLADFGAAAYIGAPTAEAPAGRAMSRFGTFEYMSPEVARGDKAGHSLETDWWSLGAMLFELLVGRTPCVIDGAESDMVVISRVVSGEIIWPRSFEPQLSPDAHDLIAQLLTVDQERRLGSRTRGGAASVRAHRFFDRADFAAIVNRCYSYPPPWIPSLVAADDTSFTPSHQDPGRYNSLRVAADSLTYDGAQWERHFAEF